jgi:hypothetical protein
MVGQLGTWLATPAWRDLVVAVLVPVVLGATLLRGRGEPRRVLLLLAGLALVVLLGGSLGYDLGTHFLYLDESGTLPSLPGLWPAGLLNITMTLAATGAWLALLAGLLGISLAARAGHWRWVLTLAVALLVGRLVGVVPFTGLQPLLDQFAPSLTFSIYLSPLSPAAIAASRGFYFWLTLLSSLTPLAALLYSLPAQPWAVPSPALAARLGQVSARLGQVSVWLGRVATLARQRISAPK